jgi:hypothetical protein
MFSKELVKCNTTSGKQLMAQKALSFLGLNRGKPSQVLVGKK